MKYKKIGIDLGCHTIKMACIQENTEILIKKYVKSYDIKDAKNAKEYFKYLKKFIKNFLKANKIRFASLCISIPYESIETNFKLIEMPKVDKKLLQKSIKYEIEEKEFVNNIENFCYTWQICNNEYTKDDYEIALSFIKKDLLKMLTKLNTNTWKVENIELQPITIGRLMKKNSVVIDFGHKATRVYMYKNGIISNAEKIDIGGKNFTQIIMNSLNISNVSVAEEMKHQSYIIDEFVQKSKDENIHRCSIDITREAKNLFDSIKRLIRAFELQNNFIIEDVYYLGGSSNLLHFIDLLSKELEIKIKPLEVLKSKEENESNLNLTNYTLSASPIVYSKSAYFNQLNFVEKTKKDIDLIPYIICLSCISLTIHLGVYGVGKVYNDDISMLKESERNQIVAIKRLESDIAKNETSKEDIRNSIDAIKSLNNQQKWTSDILYVLPEITPSNAVISNIDYSENKITLKGYTQNYSDIGFLAIKLEELGSTVITTIEDKTDGTIYSSAVDMLKNKDESKEMTKYFEMTLQYNKFLLEHDE